MWKYTLGLRQACHNGPSRASEKRFFRTEVMLKPNLGHQETMLSLVAIWMGLALMEREVSIYRFALRRRRAGLKKEHSQASSFLDKEMGRLLLPRLHIFAPFRLSLHTFCLHTLKNTFSGIHFPRCYLPPLLT